MLESIPQIGDVEKAFELFRDPPPCFMVYVRQKRSAQLRKLLSDSASLDAAIFDREVWHLESQSYRHERHIPLQLFDIDNWQNRLEKLARERAAEELREAHRRVRKVVSLSVLRLRVEPQLPPDVLGIYVYLPNQVRA